MSRIDLNDIGLSECFLQEAKIYENDNLHLARVSAQYRDMYKVLTQNGEISAVISGKLSYAASESVDYPAVGDWVLVDRTQDNGGNAVIHRILTRKSCFQRKAAGTGYDRQIVASNVDTVFICMSLNNDYSLRRVERYLSIAWDSMATPVIVLTKADLCDDIDAKLAELGSIALGVDVVITSAVGSTGYSQILKYLKRGMTVAFIGSSGVGKSTLINQLLGEELLATNELRNDHRGRHTTTHRQLFLLPSGGLVIDTPGMREIQIANADLSQSFSDIEELAKDCRFKDCRHECEPKCAVRNAIAEGKLSVQRLESYKKLQKEMAFEKRKSTMTASRAEKQKIIDLVGSINAFKQVNKYNKKNNR